MNDPTTPAEPSASVSDRLDAIEQRLDEVDAVIDDQNALLALIHRQLRAAGRELEAV